MHQTSLPKEFVRKIQMHTAYIILCITTYFDNIFVHMVSVQGVWNCNREVTKTSNFIPIIGYVFEGSKYYMQSISYTLLTGRIFKKLHLSLIDFEILSFIQILFMISQIKSSTRVKLFKWFHLGRSTMSGWAVRITHRS